MLSRKASGATRVSDEMKYLCPRAPTSHGGKISSPRARIKMGRVVYTTPARGVVEGDYTRGREKEEVA